MAASSTKLFVRNQKEEYITTLSCETVALPDSLLVTDYTRESSVLRAEFDPTRPQFNATRIRLKCISDEKHFATFRSYLQDRGKVA